MRILLLTIYYLPSPTSGAKLIADLATELATLGHEVVVATPDDSVEARLEICIESGVTVLRVKTRSIKHASRTMRAVTEMRLSQIIWNSAQHFFETHPFDLVICYSPTLFWSTLVHKLKALHGCKSYLVMRDLFPQWAVDAGLLSRHGLAYRYFRYHELRLYRSADVIGVQSPASLEYFSRPPLNGRHKVEVLFNWTKVETHPESADGMRSKLGLQGKIIFMYGGNLGVAQDMDNILRLAANLADERDVFFLLVGDGSEAGRIANEIERRGMTNVMLHPAVSQADYIKILSDCDVGLITLRRDLTIHNIPGKMLSYMQYRKPILASINPGNDLSELVQESDAGLVCDNGEDEVLYRHTLTLARSPELRRRMGANAYRLLKEKFDVTAAARQILSHFH